MKFPRWIIENGCLISKTTGEILFHRWWIAPFSSWRDSFKDKKSYIALRKKLGLSL